MLLTPVTMQKVSLYMVAADAQQATMTLAAMGVMHPLESSGDIETLPDFPAAPYAAVYHNLNSRFEKLRSYLEATFDNPAATDGMVKLEQLQDLDEQLKTIWARVSDMEEQLRHLGEKINSLRQLSNSLQKFASLDLDLGRLRRRGRFLRIVVGTVPSINFIQLKRALSLASFFIEPFYSSDGIEHVVIFGSSMQQEEVHDVLKSADFRGLTIPEEFSGSPAQLQADLDRQISEIGERSQEVKRELSDLISGNMPLLLDTHRLLILARPFSSLAMAIRGKGSLVSLQGWVPAGRGEEIRRRLDEKLEYPFHIEFSAPLSSEFDTVPTLLKRAWLFGPFQQLVKNFGIPGYREVDPSALFALSYILMFGMMFGDIGHGLIIVLGSLALRKRFPGFATIGVSVGLSSLCFGFAYGSLFGYEHIVLPLWMSPMHDPVRALLYAVIWGAGFLLVANLIAIRNDIASGLTEQAIHGSRGIAGLCFYLAAAYACYQWLVNERFGWLEGLLLILPLTMMIRFQWRQSSGPLWERALVVLIETLDHVINNVSGTLSFLRVAAFSLNHIALAAAVFAIAGMMDSLGHGITVVLGNIFIIVLEGAIVAIQCLRLEYYEGFSRFFSGKGKAFEPLKFEI
jgi:V/A-type H+/Na+-transporting ATPase subunit I